MEKFAVTYQVSGDDEKGNLISDTAILKFDAEDLDSLWKILSEGEQDESIQPELETIAIHGDIEIDCVLIHDSKGNEVYRDKDYKEE
jgi:hypothetical protein